MQSASLDAFRRESVKDGDAAPHCGSLGTIGESFHAFGSDIYRIIDDGTIDHAGEAASQQHLTVLCNAARAWGELGQRDRAAWCVDRAMKHAGAFEAAMESKHLLTKGRDEFALQVFALYLQAARQAADNEQQVRKACKVVYKLLGQPMAASVVCIPAQ
jgi:hypothetical protein